jgi:hypothetical protein
MICRRAVVWGVLLFVTAVPASAQKTSPGVKIDDKRIEVSYSLTGGGEYPASALTENTAKVKGGRLEVTGLLERIAFSVTHDDPSCGFPAPDRSRCGRLCATVPPGWKSATLDRNSMSVNPPHFGRFVEPVEFYEKEQRVCARVKNWSADQDKRFAFQLVLSK